MSVKRSNCFWSICRGDVALRQWKFDKDRLFYSKAFTLDCLQDLLAILRQPKLGKPSSVTFFPRMHKNFSHFLEPNRIPIATLKCCFNSFSFKFQHWLTLKYWKSSVETRWLFLFLLIRVLNKGSLKTSAKLLKISIIILAFRFYLRLKLFSLASEFFFVEKFWVSRLPCCVSSPDLFIVLRWKNSRRNFL